MELEYIENRLTYEDLQQMIDRQNNKCAICGDTPSKKLVIDHCHAFGFVRGLLCSRCNSGLGLFKDNAQILRVAVDYLDNLPFAVKHRLYDGRIRPRKRRTAEERSERCKIANSKRKNLSGPPKKLGLCSHCGEFLGVLERRKHGDVTEMARLAEYERFRQARLKAKKNNSINVKETVDTTANLT